MKKSSIRVKIVSLFLSIGILVAVSQSLHTMDKYVIATGSYSGIITLWDLESQLLQIINQRNFHSGLSFCPLGKHIAGVFYDGDVYTIKVFDERGNLFKRFPFFSYVSSSQPTYLAGGGITDAIEFPCINVKFFAVAGKKYILASADNIIKVFSLDKGLLYSFDNNATVDNLAVVKTNKGVIAAAAGKDRVRVYTIGGFRAKEIIRLKHREVKAVDISLDGKYIVSGGQQEVKVWDIKKKRLINRYKISDGVFSIAFSPVPDALGGFFVAGLGNGNIGVFRVSRPYSHEILQVHETEIPLILCTPDGKYIISGNRQGNIAVIANKRDIIKRFNIGGINALAIKPFVQKETDQDLQERVGYLHEQLEILGELQKEKEAILQELEALQGGRKKVSFERYQKKVQEQEVERKLQELEQRAKRWKERFREESVFYQEKKK